MSELASSIGNDALIAVKDVVKQYRSGVILSHIDLQIQKGEFVAIVGPSGSGKSTLLHILGGIDGASAGNVFVCGRDMGKLNNKEAANFRNKVIGFVFQFFYLQPYMNISKNLEIPMMPSRTPREQRRTQIAKVAKLVGIENKLEAFPKDMSGGELQRAAIARAIINDPQIILADEPTGNLDDANSKNIMRLLLTIKKERGTSLVIVTHDERIACLADRIFRLENGALVNAKN